MPAPIFISYRRSDTAGHAGRLLDRLLQWWDADAVFFDTHTIEAGEAFPDVLEQAVDAARLMLVVIGFFLLGLVCLAALVLTIIAGIKANEGKAYRYPFCLRLIK